MRPLRGRSGSMPARHWPIDGGSPSDMIGSLPARPLRTGLLVLACLGALSPPTSTALAQAQAPPEASPGQFFLIEEPIDSEVLERIKASTKQLLARTLAQKSPAPVLVFEFRPGAGPAGLERLRHLVRAGQLPVDRAGRVEVDGCLRPATPERLRRPPRARLRRAGHGTRCLDRPDHPRGRGRQGRLPGAGQDPRPPQGEGPGPLRRPARPRRRPQARQDRRSPGALPPPGESRGLPQGQPGGRGRHPARLGRGFARRP